MLVIERAIMPASDGEVEYPADMLNDLGKYISAYALTVTGVANSRRSPDQLPATSQVQDIRFGPKIVCIQ
jgi:hypothetical protein